MPYSYSLFKNEVARHIIDTIPTGSRILDVGVGSGSYWNLLNSKFPEMEGIEIFPDYVNSFGLRDKYRTLHIGDIREHDLTGYDYVIMGDILEHLSYPDALSVLDKINVAGAKAMVAVPYLYEQGTEFGNVHETHLQPDLTPEVMSMRYPMLRLLIGDEKYGYYVNYDGRI